MPDPAMFAEEILPLLQSVSIRAMATATGLTAGYWSLIRGGSRAPHPMRWNNLRAVASIEAR
jgi:hypothetical protein